MAISDYIPNIFGVENTNYAGLLEPKDAAALSKQSNIAGLLGTVAALGQGMSSQGPRRSALQNILSAVGAGYGAAGQTYQGSIEQMVNAQKLAQMKLQMQQNAATQESITNMLNDPAIKSDPLAIAYIRSNPADAIKEYAQQKAFQRERDSIRQSMFGTQPAPAQGGQVEGAALPTQGVQGNSEIAMLEQQIQNTMADAAAYGARRDPAKQKSALDSVEKLRERQASLLVGDVDIRDRMTNAPEGFKPQYKTIADLKETGVLKGKELLDAIQRVDQAVLESGKQYRYDGITGQYAYQMFGTNDATKLSPEQNRNILAYANAPTQADQTKIAIDAQKLKFETGAAPALPTSREQMLQSKVPVVAPAVVPSSQPAAVVQPTQATAVTSTAPTIRSAIPPMAQAPAPKVSPEMQRTGEAAPEIKPTTMSVQVPKGTVPLINQPDKVISPKRKQELEASRNSTIGLVNYTLKNVVDAKQAAESLLNNPAYIKSLSGITAPAMANVPGTDAYTAKKLLDNLLGRAFITEIQQMRQASPTGGAVGSVAVQEMTTLSNIQSALAAGMKESELRKQLKQYISNADRATKTIPQEYARTYGYSGEFEDILKGGVVQQQPSGLPSGVTVKRK
jgi:hypothetical protein